MLRKATFEAARVAVNHDPRTRAFYERIKNKRDDKKTFKAVVFEMLKIIQFMLT